MRKTLEHNCILFPEAPRDLERIQSQRRAQPGSLEETLAVHKLRMPEMLRESMASTILRLSVQNTIFMTCLWRIAKLALVRWSLRC
jgi:hypothetical protein